MNLYRVIVLQMDKENLERGVWADKMDINGTNIVFLKEDEGFVLQTIAVYPAQYTIVSNIESKVDYDKRKATL